MLTTPCRFYLVRWAYTSTEILKMQMVEIMLMAGASFEQLHVGGHQGKYDGFDQQEVFGGLH